MGRQLAGRGWLGCFPPYANFVPKERTMPDFADGALVGEFLLRCPAPNFFGIKPGITYRSGKSGFFKLLCRPETELLELPIHKAQNPLYKRFL